MVPDVDSCTATDYERRGNEALGIEVEDCRGGRPTSPAASRPIARHPWTNDAESSVHVPLRMCARALHGFELKGRKGRESRKDASKSSGRRGISCVIYNLPTLVALGAPRGASSRTALHTARHKPRRLQKGYSTPAVNDNGMRWPNRLGTAADASNPSTRLRSSSAMEGKRHPMF